MDERILCNLIFTTRATCKKGLVMPAHTIKVKHEAPVKPSLCLMLALKLELEETPVLPGYRIFRIKQPLLRAWEDEQHFPSISWVNFTFSSKQVA